ncbi:MAG: hypothetical protein K5886_04285 [Lachnospiraceae bacterium]|nr:hypothetical protein [Lachnospiraceae bacterium]
MMNAVNILIDIGGSGIKVAEYKDKKIGKIETFNNISSFDEFTKMIKKRQGTNHLKKIAISSAGFIDPENGRFIECRCAPYLEGDTVKMLNKEFPFAKVSVVNDGEAHTRALLVPGRDVRFGAIHLAFGTAVSFGVINEKGEIIRTCSGGNWDIGDYLLRTREAPYEVYRKLGAEGLRELEENFDGDPYRHFGLRVGGLLTNLAVIFRPRTIGLSGGIIASQGKRIFAGIQEEFKTPVSSDKIRFALLEDPDTVMQGLTTLC